MEDWLVVLSRAREGPPALREFENALEIGLVRTLGLDLLVVPPLYDLREGDEAERALRAAAAPLVVLAWAYPRATYWTLRAAGVVGRRQDVRHTAPPPPGRPIIPLDLRGTCCLETVLETVRGIVGVAGPRPVGAVRRIDGAPPLRWYPVLDRDRCTACLECVEFCLFGVYDVDAGGRPVVADPDRCKPGCPACSRVCPERAIMFPFHPSTPAIAGADDGAIEPLTAESIARDRIPAVCPEVLASGRATGGAAPCACRPGVACEHRAASPGPPAPCECDCACDGTPAERVTRALEDLDQDQA